ncbi:MAG: glucose-6-phosphate isomerase [Alphaproteobacteria bacterium HGW-Alphaproteobacteria-12]|nr:MAG: glucose-6-phosphate isomerase [Alphaproteobacteria bacterium HGW-Alphaproteobacteria-12]
MAENPLPYSQSLDNCFSDAIGEGGLSHAAFDAALSESEAALDWLRAVHESGDLPLLRVPERRDDFARIEEVGEKLLDDTTDIFIFGIGGSALGAQALAQLTGWGTQAHVQKNVRIHIPDNLDAATMEAAFSNVDLRTTRFLVVSKSGSTVEPAIQTLSAMSALEKAGGGKYMKHHFAVLTEPAKHGKPNPMRALAQANGFPTLEHDPGVGGRYAVLTNVGLLPAYLMGLDLAALREGAASALAPVLKGAPAKDVPAAAGAALSVAMAREKGTAISVFLAYADRLERFLAWHCQLWAESLGKDGKGTTPLKALGPVDQHSQLQLWLAGPRDKLFNVFMLETKGKGPEALASVAAGTEFAFLGGRRIGDLVDAEQRATADTLARNGCPVRSFILPRLDERTLGALFMHFMLETIIAGRMLGVDPFDQPAVEEGKILARKYLAEGTP